MFNLYKGRHRRPTVPSLTAEALVDLWAGRSIGDAAELARIDMRDRMAVAS